jgi:hypothetical protein
MIKINETVIYFFSFIIILSSFYLGYQHSVYNQDYHHSFFILKSLIEYEKGLKLFDDIILQYGPGQLIFFNFLGKFINLNLVSISLFTSFFYSINLLFLFRIFQKISSTYIAFLLLLTIYLIHPYNIYPWPDYLSGLCITMFFYFFLKENSKYSFFLCSIFLFLAIFFRSTYILNILFSIICYSFFLFIYKKKNPLKLIFVYFLISTIVYFFILFLNGNLQNWFNQSIGQIAVYAIETKHTELFNIITSYVGESGFIIIKIIYYFLNSTLSLIDISNIKNIFFVLFILINITFLFISLKKKLQISYLEKKILFISILGLFGFVQSLMLMEIFRNINATMGIVISSLFLFKQKKIDNFLGKYLKIISVTIFIYLCALFFQFPFINYNKNNYENFNNKYFLNKKLLPEIKTYYSNISKLICNDEKIILSNISNDFGINHICNNNNLIDNINLPYVFLKNHKEDEYNRLFIHQDLAKNELLFSDQKINKLRNIKLIKIFEIPFKPKKWYPNIHVYKKQ